ncbi:SsrA-binding protein [Candidatus Woesebacteria bacterium]|nr:MAG: SsrA-binding protein [Candidatus Woesebacteria bacterium]
MKIVNRKAQFNYQLIERIEAGIVLAGHEVRAVKNGHVDLATAYAKIMGDEAYLINANIASNISGDYSPTRARKLLLHKNQIISLQTKIQAKKLTLVPTKMYTKARLIKVEIALAKSKRKFEKKELKKKKDIEREIERELKG